MAGRMSVSDKKAWGTAAATEPRWPASLAVLVAAGLNFAISDKFTLGPPWLFPLIELAILIPLSFAAPNRRPTETRAQQVAAIALIAVVNIANFASLFFLIRLLLFAPKEVTGLELLYSSFAIWVTN